MTPCLAQQWYLNGVCDFRIFCFAQRWQIHTARRRLRKCILVAGHGPTLHVSMPKALTELILFSFIFALVSFIRIYFGSHLLPVYLRIKQFAVSDKNKGRTPHKWVLKRVQTKPECNGEAST